MHADIRQCITCGIDEGGAARGQRQLVALQRQRQRGAQARQLPLQCTGAVQLRTHRTHLHRQCLNCGSTGANTMPH